MLRRSFAPSDVHSKGCTHRSGGTPIERILGHSLDGEDLHKINVPPLLEIVVCVVRLFLALCIKPRHPSSKRVSSLSQSHDKWYKTVRVC
jgi:hypothetical protein